MNLIPKVVFISHDASRTGAPMMLLHLLKWLKENTNLEVIIILKFGGPLQSEFEKIGTTFTYYSWYNNEGNIIQKLFKKTKEILRSFSNRNTIISKLKEFKPNLIYSNTITNGVFCAHLVRYLKCPIITHVHELEATIKQFGVENIQAVITQTAHYIAASEAVKNNLLLSYQLSENLITVIHEFIPAHSYSMQKSILSFAALKKELGITSENPFIIGGSGTIEWRKGADLFLMVAESVISKSQNKDFYFVWVGGDLNNVENEKLAFDFSKLSSKANIVFLGNKINPIDYFHAFNVFFLPSREDPYPLVCLENASLGKPIICFEQSGGMPEFVQKDSGAVVPYLNLEAVVNTIIEWKNSPDKVKRLGNNASKNVIQNHDVNIIAPKVLDLIYFFSS